MISGSRTSITPGRFTALRGDRSKPADIGVAIPVNAKVDLDKVRDLLGDISRYDGAHAIEVVLVVNNYPPDEPPAMIETYKELGLAVAAAPSVREPGKPAGFSARIIGIRHSASDAVVSFDADCRIAQPTALLDWYITQFQRGADVAYTHVGYFDLQKGLVVQLRVLSHHGSRWVKRALLRIPTTRGSNYAVRKSFLLPLYDEGYLADELNVGPVAKAKGGRVVYGGGKRLQVTTSGRYLGGNLVELVRYLWYRLRYNLRTIPVSRDAAKRTRRS